MPEGDWGYGPTKPDYAIITDEVLESHAGILTLRIRSTVWRGRAASGTREWRAVGPKTLVAPTRKLVNELVDRVREGVNRLDKIIVDLEALAELDFALLISLETLTHGSRFNGRSLVIVAPMSSVVRQRLDAMNASGLLRLSSSFKAALAEVRTARR